jgi:hypothetical protein
MRMRLHFVAFAILIPIGSLCSLTNARTERDLLRIANQSHNGTASNTKAENGSGNSENPRLASGSTLFAELAKPVDTKKAKPGDPRANLYNLIPVDLNRNSSYTEYPDTQESQ